MVNVVNVAMELGYMNVPEGLIIDIDHINKYPPEKIVIITTGSQGEPMSALTRMASVTIRRLKSYQATLLLFPQIPYPEMKNLFQEW